MSFLKFQDVRLILSVQGYELNNQYIIRELGYWYPLQSGVIPFNCKLNVSNLDSFSQKNIHIAESEFHGIKLKKKIENGLPASEACAAIRTLYHVSKRDDYAADYIGILNDEKIPSKLVFNSGLGKYAIILDELECLTETNSTLPTIHDFKYIIGTELNKYIPCGIHENLRNNETPLCARTKVEIVANHFKLLKKQQQSESQSANTNLNVGQPTINTTEQLFNLFAQQMSSNK